MNQIAIGQASAMAAAGASAERSSLLAEAERTIRAGSKSFRFASTFDSDARAGLVLYSCTGCDDLADGQTPPRLRRAADPERRIDSSASHRPRLAGEKTGLAACEALGLVAAECQIPRRLSSSFAGFGSTPRMASASGGPAALLLHLSPAPSAADAWGSGSVDDARRCSTGPSRHRLPARQHLARPHQEQRSTGLSARGGFRGRTHAGSRRAGRARLAIRDMVSL